MYTLTMVHFLLVLTCTISVLVASKRIMVNLLAYNLNHLKSIIIIFNEYKLICEAGWKPTIFFYTGIDLDNEILSYLEEKSYCYSTNSSIPMKVIKFDHSLGIYLSQVHRTYVENHIHDYDVFIYQEDDIIFEYSHLVAYLYETKKLQEISSDVQ